MMEHSSQGTQSTSIKMCQCSFQIRQKCSLSHLDQILIMLTFVKIFVIHISCLKFNDSLTDA